MTTETFKNTFEDRLTAAMHSAIEYQYDECDHGKYMGGPSAGEPYEMCRIHARRLIESGAVADPWKVEETDALKAREAQIHRVARKAARRDVWHEVRRLAQTRLEAAGAVKQR